MSVPECPFEIVTEYGDRAEALDEYGALAAVVTLRKDHKARLGGWSMRPLTVYVIYEGQCVLVVGPEMKPSW